jgi:hypothetical protein
MARETVAEFDGRKVIIMDSITHVEEEDTDQIVVSASHGGVSSGGFACEHRLGAVFFNDAGVGKENAGIAALEMLEQRSVAAGTVSNESAKIGEARDHWENGVISHLNETARAAGLREGEPLREAISSVYDTGSARTAG